MAGPRRTSFLVQRIDLAEHGELRTSSFLHCAHRVAADDGDLGDFYFLYDGAKKWHMLGNRGADKRGHPDL